MSHFRLALPLAICGALAPFALDTYLPAFPAMAEQYGVSVHALSLSISVYIFVLAAGQLFAGPLADRLGRTVVMRAGLVVFMLTSMLIALTEQLWLLLGLRAIQALGGGAVMVCVPALVREYTHGREAAKLFSMVGLIAVAAPAVAPSLGALLLNLGWQSIFIFLTIYAVIVWCVLELTLFRSHRHDAYAQGQKSHESLSALQRYGAVLSIRPALRYIFLQGLLFAVMMLFVTHASFVYQTHFQVSERTFALLFGANIGVMWLTMLCNRLLLQKFRPSVILRVAAVMQMLAVAAMVVVASFNLSVYFFAPALMLTVGMVGATSPNCQACYMDYFPRNGATAAAVMGGMQFGLAGLLSCVSSFLPESLIALTSLQLGCASLVLLLIVWPRRKIATGEFCSV